MSNIPISSLPGANPLTGEEIVPIVQAGTTKQSTTGNISALPFGSAAGSASAITFITVSSATAALPSSRVLSATSPVLLTDGGAGGSLTIGLSIVPGTGTVTSVGLSGGATGLTISNSPITTTGTMTIGGRLGVPFGGTGTTTIPANRVLIGDTTGTSITSVAAATTSGYLLNAVSGAAPQWQPAVTSGGTAGQLLVGQGAASDPIWRTVSGDVALSSTGVATVGNALGHAIINLPATTGLVVATTSTTATQRSLTSGTGITITNSDGSGGNPTIALAQIAGLSVLGTSTSATGTPFGIAGAAGQILQVNSGGTNLVFGRAGSATTTPLSTTITSTSTYTVAANVKYLIVETWGGGGGGGAGAGTGPGGDGQIGGTTSFGGVITSIGGAGGKGGGGAANLLNAGAGGLGGSGGTPGDVTWRGWPGTPGVAGAATVGQIGGAGGGAGGGIGQAAGAGLAGLAPGGGGGGGASAGNAGSAGGGGSGEYQRKLITSLSATYAVNIGGGGIGGSVGTGGAAAGGTGGLGYCVVGAFFQ